MRRIKKINLLLSIFLLGTEGVLSSVEAAGLGPIGRSVPTHTPRAPRGEGSRVSGHTPDRLNTPSSRTSQEALRPQRAIQRPSSTIRTGGWQGGRPAFRQRSGNLLGNVRGNRSARRWQPGRVDREAPRGPMSVARNEPIKGQTSRLDDDLNTGVRANNSDLSAPARGVDIDFGGLSRMPALMNRPAASSRGAPPSVAPRQDRLGDSTNTAQWRDIRRPSKSQSSQ